LHEKNIVNYFYQNNYLTIIHNISTNESFPLLRNDYPKIINGKVLITNSKRHWGTVGINRYT